MLPFSSFHPVGWVETKTFTYRYIMNGSFENFSAKWKNCTWESRIETHTHIRIWCYAIDLGNFSECTIAWYTNAFVSTMMYFICKCFNFLWSSFFQLHWSKWKRKTFQEMIHSTIVKWFKSKWWTWFIVEFSFHWNFTIV